MKSHWIIAFLITGALVISAGAQDNDARPTNSVVAQRRSPDANAYSKGGNDTPEHTITVDVWSSAESNARTEMEPAKVSRSFAAAGLNAAFKIELTERKLENSIRRGFPLGEFWIQNDLAEINDSLKLAALAVANDSDREALRQLETQTTRLRFWTEWLITENRRLALTEYYISSSTLDNDQQFQNTVKCTKFLVSMLASRTLAEDSSCL